MAKKHPKSSSRKNSDNAANTDTKKKRSTKEHEAEHAVELV
jgi:hypothetical protein